MLAFCFSFSGNASTTRRITDFDCLFYYLLDRLICLFRDGCETNFAT